MNKKLLYLLLFLCSYSYAQSISTNYIRAKYTFDNGSVLEDSSVTGNDFTQTGTALTEINDRFDIAPTSAVSLNGDYLTRATIPVTGTSTFNVSYSFWLKTSTNTTDVKTVIDHSTRNTAIGFDSDDRGYYIFYRDGKISLSSRFIVTNPGFNPSVIGYGHEHPTVIADGKWHHIVVEFSALHNYQGQTVNSKIYIDKTVNSHSLTTSPITTTPITTGNVTIANSRYNHLALANRYADVIDDLIIYDRKFTTAEVAVLANHNNYCFTPSASIITIPTTSNTAATVSIANSGTYDIAYHKASESFTNATIVTGITTGTANLSGLDIASDYLIYIREQCTNVTDWSSSVAFATTRPSTTLYVNKNATGDNDGTSWANAYVNLQDALTNVVSDDEIWIAGGTYTPHASDRNTYFVIDKENLKIYGGFAGTETQISDRIKGANETILSGDLQDNDVNLTSFIDNYGNTTRNSDNSYHIVDIKASGKNLELNSLTISDAHTNVDATEAGGAILKERTIAKLTIKNCIIKDNVSRNDNAGLLAVFDLNNVSGIRGTLIVENSQFINNMSRWATGIYSYPMTNTNVDITIVNSLFDGNITGNLNYTTAKGISGSAAWFRVLSNTSDLTLNFTNNTLVNNIDDGTLNVSASTHAVLALSKSSGFNGTFNAEVSNNIFWNNRTSGNAVTRSITDLYKLPITSLNVYNSIDESNFIDNSITSTVNISNADPLFTSTTDFTLLPNSPAIDTGDNTKIPSGVSIDLLGNQRIVNTVDMGAYEFDGVIPCTVTIPDANFKTYLVGNTTINTNGDTEIQCDEAAAFTGVIDINNLGITDITGIEYFINFTSLNASYNSLTSIDLSSNTALEYLDLTNNLLTSLDITTHTALTELHCWNNSITTINLTNNTLLTKLDFHNNSLTNLDLSANIALSNLRCTNNQLGGLDLSSNAALEYLTIYGNSLTSLDLSNNVALIDVYCYSNSLTSLDVSNNPNLVALRCMDNDLTSLNVANGNNANMWAFNTTSNPNLTCIEVDNVTYSDTNWSASKDVTASFSTNCAALGVNDYELKNIALYPNPVNNTLNIQIEDTLEKVEVYSILGKKVLEANTSSVNASNLSSGVYMLKVYTLKGKVGVKRFIKQD